MGCERCALIPDAEWTKNREASFQPIPASLTGRLYEFARSGEPVRLYAKFLQRKDATREIPGHPLLYAPSDPSRELGKDLNTAGIPKHTAEGKVDFHACRVAYITFVIESGANVKEAQVLARHKTPDLTMNVYGRVRQDQLSKTIERLGETLQPQAKCGTYVHQSRVGREAETTTSIKNRDLYSARMMELRGIEPLTS